MPPSFETFNQVRPHFSLVKVQLDWIVAMHCSCHKCQCKESTVCCHPFAVRFDSNFFFFGGGRTKFSLHNYGGKICVVSHCPKLITFGHLQVELYHSGLGVVYPLRHPPTLSVWVGLIVKANPAVAHPNGRSQEC